MKTIIELDDDMLKDIRESDFEVSRKIVRDFQATISDSIRNGKLIPKGATNGDVIEAMFPNCEQKEHMNNGYFEMYFDNDLKNASYMRVSKDWWNAPYQRGGEE